MADELTDREVFAAIKEQKKTDGERRTAAFRSNAVQAGVEAGAAGLIFAKCSGAHYQIRKPRGWLINVYPSNGRIYPDPKRGRSPWIKVDWDKPGGLTAVDFVRAAIAAETGAKLETAKLNTTVPVLQGGALGAVVGSLDLSDELREAILVAFVNKSPVQMSGMVSMVNGAPVLLAVWFENVPRVSRETDRAGNPVGDFRRGGMMLQIVCDACKCSFWVKGYTTPDTFDEPGEVVTELESDAKLCDCLENGGTFTIVNEEQQTFLDDVI